MEPAPYRADLAEGPDDVDTVWATASDEARLRVAVWHAAGGKGTILLFPGRTEYIEKYGRVACALTSAGFTVATIDWRGQGFSDRLAEDRLLGHVLLFGDYQRDVAALLQVIHRMNLPAPFHLLAHSMGGHIALRYLHDHPGVIERAVLVSPMIDIFKSSISRWFVRTLTYVAGKAGRNQAYVIGSGDYSLDAERFEGNRLTSDPKRFLDEKKAIEENPDLAASILSMPSISACV